MKRVIAACIVFVVLLSCSGSSTRYKNPYLPNYNFSMTIDTGLPLYNKLTRAIDPMRITDPASGVTFFAMKMSDTDYRVWDAYCPNQYPTSCSLMNVFQTSNAKCACEDYTYNLITGVGSENVEYTMRPFRFEVVNSRVIRVYN